MDNVTITLSVSYDEIKTKALRLLSVLGKRTVTQDGNSQFTRVQVSTAEEPLIIDFVEKAFQDIMEKIAPCVSNYTDNENGAVCDISFFSWSKLNESAITSMFRSKVYDYCMSIAIADYLSLYFPQQSQFYKDRAFGILSSILSVCYTKRPEEAEGSYFTSTTAGALIGWSGY